MNDEFFDWETLHDRHGVPIALRGKDHPMLVPIKLLQVVLNDLWMDPRSGGVFGPQNTARLAQKLGTSREAAERRLQRLRADGKFGFIKSVHGIHATNSNSFDLALTQIVQAAAARRTANLPTIVSAGTNFAGNDRNTRSS